MGSFTKEPLESATSTGDPAARADLSASQGTRTVSLDAFGIEIPVQLQGGRAGTSAHSAPDTYHEDTCTLIVFPQGAVLRLSFRLPRSQRLIETRCEVRYCLPVVGVGVEYVDLDDSSRLAIEDELSHL